MSPNTALLLIDPYNDFLHKDGKLNPMLAESIEASKTIDRMRRVIKTARDSDIPIFYCLHQQTDSHSFAGWRYMNSSHAGLKAKNAFESGTWGAKIFDGMEPVFEKGDVVVSKHWNSSSFANTDLDYQLRQRSITKLVFAGLIANTCLEATARYAYELEYEVTLLTDATAGFTTASKDAATNLIWPLFATRVLNTEQWVESLSQASNEGRL